jgi:hypothetical protein
MRFCSRLIRSVGHEGMPVLKMFQVYERGLRDFESLAPLERDYFVIKDLDNYFEMEGGIGAYVIGGAYSAQVEWAKEALRRTGDIVSAGIISELQTKSGSQRAEIEKLSERYVARQVQRWRLLESYLTQRGITLDDGQE